MSLDITGPAPRGDSSGSIEFGVQPSIPDDLEVSIREAAPGKIDFGQATRCSAYTGSEGNVRLNLENNLIKYYHSKNPDDEIFIQHKLDDLTNLKRADEPEIAGARQEILDKVQPEIAHLYGKLPRKNPDNADSEIIFRRWEYNTMEGDRIGTCLKLEMTWQIELNDGTILESRQEVEIPGTVMVDPGNVEDYKHCKHLALLYAKGLRKMQKKAMRSSYTINPALQEDGIDQTKLIEGLRATNIFMSVNHPSENLISGARVITGHANRILAGETARFTGFETHTGYRVLVGYDEYSGQGRKKVTYKPGELLPSGKKADRVITKYIKTDAPDLGYDLHLLQQAEKAVIEDDSIFAKFEKLSKNQGNIADELKNEVEKSDFKRYVLSSFKLKAKQFDQLSSRMQNNVLERFPLNIAGMFAPNKVFKFAMKQVAKNFNEALDKYKNASDADKPAAFKELKDAYEGIKELPKFVNQLTDLQNDLKNYRDQLKQLPGRVIKGEVVTLIEDSTLEAVQRKISNYQDVIDASDNIKEAKRIIDANAIKP